MFLLPFHCRLRLRRLLAVGGHLKNVFALARGNFAYQSQHLGDLENPTGIEFFEDSLAHLTHTFEIDPQTVVHDLHPGYLSTTWAKQYAAEQRLRLIGVQHHHAHIAACMAEHALTRGSCSRVEPVKLTETHRAAKLPPDASVDPTRSTIEGPSSPAGAAGPSDPGEPVMTPGLFRRAFVSPPANRMIAVLRSKTTMPRKLWSASQAAQRAPKQSLPARCPCRGPRPAACTRDPARRRVLDSHSAVFPRLRGDVVTST